MWKELTRREINPSQFFQKLEYSNILLGPSQAEQREGGEVREKEKGVGREKGGRFLCQTHLGRVWESRTSGLRYHSSFLAVKQPDPFLQASTTGPEVRSL